MPTLRGSKLDSREKGEPLFCRESERIKRFLVTDRNFPIIMHVASAPVSIHRKPHIHMIGSSRCYQERKRRVPTRKNERSVRKNEIDSMD